MGENIFQFDSETFNNDWNGSYNAREYGNDNDGIYQFLEEKNDLEASVFPLKFTKPNKYLHLSSEIARITHFLCFL